MHFPKAKLSKAKLSIFKHSSQIYVEYLSKAEVFCFRQFIQTTTLYIVYAYQMLHVHLYIPFTPHPQNHSLPVWTDSLASVNAYGTILREIVLGGMVPYRRGGSDQYRMVLLASVNVTILYQSILL